MNNLKLRFNNFYNKLPKREQYMLIAMSVLIFTTLLYLIIWEPVYNSLDQQAEKKQNQKKILVWMQDAEKEVIKIRASGNFVSPQTAGQSINSLVERSAISAGIRSSINKMDSASKDSLKVQLKSVEFDRLMQWLGKLQANYGITPKHVTISQSEKPGIVSCRITLEKTS